jgi:hypothetical protein
MTMATSVGRSGAAVPGRAERLGITETVGMPLTASLLMQVVFWLSDPADVQRLDELRRNLIDGPLSRRLVAARVPGARPYWLRSTYDYPLTVEPGVLPAAAMTGWLNQQAATELDLTVGRGWALSAVNLDDGTSAASLVVSHAITDGRGLFAAIDLAARSDASHAVPDRRRTTVSGDLFAAVKGAALLPVPAAVIRLLVLRAARLRDGRVATGAAPLVIALDTEQLRAVAARRGGTATGLITTMSANIAHALGDQRARDVRVAVNVSTREPGDLTAKNMVAIGELTLLMPAAARYVDLSEVRRRSKDAYAAAGTPKIVGRGPDVAVSNIGPVPPSVFEAAGSTRAVLVRVSFQARTVLARHYMDTLRTTIVQSPDTTFVTLDPPLSETAALLPYVDRELQSWEEVTPRFVC